MFVREELPREKLTDEGMRMVDHGRDAWLQCIKRYPESDFQAFKLVWHGKQIPFLAEKSFAPPAGFQPKDNDRGKHHLHWTIAPERYARFGEANVHGVSSYTFLSESEAEESLQLAAEALVAYGSCYNGSESAHALNTTVGYRDRVWSKDSSHG